MTGLGAGEFLAGGDALVFIDERMRASTAALMVEMTTGVRRRS
jgi:hypothetical protein